MIFAVIFRVFFPIVSGRPLKEALQVAADVVDRVQVKATIGAKNRLYSVQ